MVVCNEFWKGKLGGRDGGGGKNKTLGKGFVETHDMNLDLSICLSKCNLFAGT